MSAKYYKQDDLLVLKLSKKPFKAAEKIGSFIVHYDEKREPVLIEVLNASKFLKETSKAMPKSMRESIFLPHGKT
jgi:uncharacterized protein YuzE